MKLLTVTIRPVLSFDRAIGWYAEIDAPDRTGRCDQIFHRSSKRQVEKLVARLLSAKIEKRGW